MGGSNSVYKYGPPGHADERGVVLLLMHHQRFVARNELNSRMVRKVWSFLEPMLESNLRPPGALIGSFDFADRGLDVDEGPRGRGGVGGGRIGWI